MPDPSLFPKFMNPLGGGDGGGGDGLVVALAAEPTVTLDPEIVVTPDDETIVVTLDPEIEVEVE